MKMEVDRGSLLVGLGIGAVAGVVGGLYFTKSRGFGSHNDGKAVPTDQKKTKDYLVSENRRLKLYHSFPFRSSRCAWLINELGIQDMVEVVPVSLHGPGAQDLPKYKSEV